MKIIDKLDQIIETVVVEL